MKIAQDGDLTKKQVVFIHGAGKGARADDGKLAANLRELLGAGYEVHYPVMEDEENPDYKTWKSQIEKEIASLDGNIFLVGHSMGGCVLIKALTQIKTTKSIAGIFLIAAPYWGGEGWKYKGYRKMLLPKEVEDKLPEAPIYLYHSSDDENVPVEHLALYLKKLPNATARKLEERGHQLNNDLHEVADDIRAVNPNSGNTNRK